MSILENYEKYRYHYALLAYRQSAPNERLTIFRTSIHQTSLTLCGYAAVLQSEGGKNTPSVDIAKLRVRFQRICQTLRTLSDELAADPDANDQIAREQLVNLVKYRHIVDELRDLSQYVQKLKTDLPLNIDSASLSKTLVDKALALQANWDILVNTDEPHIPSDILKAYEVLWESTPGDPKQLALILDVAVHPLATIRHDAAILLRHYRDERAVTALIEMLRDDAEDVIAESANSLGHLQSQEAVPALIASLDREFENPAYIGWIAEALSHMPDESALDSLIALLDRYLCDPLRKWQLETLPIAGLRKAIAAIGGDKAKAALTRYFNNPEL